MTGIYKITSPTGKVYIGQSHNINKRFNQYKNLNCKEQSRIYNSLKKHGPNNHTFDVIMEMPDNVNQHILDYQEQFCMDAYSALGYELMNLRGGGARGLFSEESKKRMSQSSKGKNTWSKGSKRTDEQKRNTSIAVKKWHHENGRIPKKRMTPKEFAEYLRKIRIGIPRPEFKGENNPFYGKKHDEETRRIMSEKGKLNKLGDKNGRARAIYQLDLEGNIIREWSNITEASKETGINRLTISTCLNGKIKTAKGFKWKYKNETKNSNNSK